MAQPVPVRPQVRFGPFTADLRTRELWKYGTRIKLQERPFEILAMLLEHPGEVVSRDDIRIRLWPDGTFVDFDNNISSAVGKLRTTLMDSAAAPRYIETVGRRGYRFIAETSSVTAVEPIPRARLYSIEGANPPAAGAAPRVGSRRQTAVLALLVIVCLGLLLGFALYGRIGKMQAAKEGPGAVPGIRSLAVLPLENLSNDSSEAYFADGMTDELITELGQISSLRVISRTSIMQYKGVHKPMPQIARELNVDAVVEGTVLKSGDHVRVTAQLIQATSDKHLWAQSYEGELRDIFGLQKQVAETIAHQIRITLTPQEQVALHRERAVDPAAYVEYLRGRALMNRRTPESLKEAVQRLQAATERDREYAVPYAALARAYLLLQQYGAMSNDESLPNAERAARRALELDGALSEAHTALGVIHVDSNWDWQDAEGEHKRAVEANPNDASAHQWYAEFLIAQGRTSEALAEIHKAQLLDPLSEIVHVVAGEVSFFARDYDGAIRESLKAVAISPDFAPAYSFIGMSYAQKREYAKAEQNLREAIALSHQSPMSTSFLGAVYALSGRTKEARTIRRQLAGQSNRRYISAVDFAILDSALGANENALADLNKAAAQRDHWLAFLQVDPRLDSLRSDPQFRELLRRVRLQ